MRDLPNVELGKSNLKVTNDFCISRLQDIPPIVENNIRYWGFVLDARK